MKLLTIFSGLIFLLYIFSSRVSADPFVSRVVINNAPKFSTPPLEETGSSQQSPTNTGSDVIFKSMANDSDGDNYYLAICRTNEIQSSDIGAPVCTGGAWCVSSLTQNNGEASCAYTVSQSDPEVNNWYAFVCNNNTTNGCSDASPGHGEQGSPFYVNHPPVLSSVTKSSPVDPGGEIVFISTSGDTDNSGRQDTVKLLVCKKQGISGGRCVDAWCESGEMSINASCSFSLPIPFENGDSDAFIYLIDSHRMESASVLHGANSRISINNVSPKVTNVILNSGSDIVNAVGGTEVVLSATVEDINGCHNTAQVGGSLYRSGLGYSKCNEDREGNPNYCYLFRNCTEVTEGNRCTGSGDTSADYLCKVNIGSIADPTDENTPYWIEDWKATVKAEDKHNAVGEGDAASGVELLSLLALETGLEIDYGRISIGQTIDPLDRSLEITNRGNSGLDLILQGSDLVSDTGRIDVSLQRYALERIEYRSGSSLSGNAKVVMMNIPKPKSGTVETKNLYWGISIPSDAPAGEYRGINTVIGIKSDPDKW